MTADAPGATQNYSREPGSIRGAQRPFPGALRGAAALRAVLAAVALAGVAALVLSTVIPVVEIRVLATSDVAGQDTRLTGGELHGVALVLVAAFALVMLFGASRGARPAMAALAASGLLALGLIVGLDVPELANAGQLRQFYEDVSAGAAAGFYLETAGAVALLLAGGGMLIASATSRQRRADVSPTDSG